MDSWLYVYKVYAETKTLDIVKRVFFYDCKQKINLWLATLAILSVIFITLFFYVDSLWKNIVLLFLPWAVFAYHSAYKFTFARYFEQGGNAIWFYSNKHQYLRYMIFRDKLISDNRLTPSAIEDAKKYMSIHFGTMYHENVSNNAFVALVGAVLIGVISSSSGKWTSETTMLVVLYLIVIYAFSSMIIGASSSSTSRIKEVERFLLWFSEESTPNKANSADAKNRRG